VLYVGTFSKVPSPAIRVGYLVVPRPLRAAFEAAHQVMGGQPSPILQGALAAFMDGGHLGRHITKMRAVYDERRRFASAEFGRLFGDKAEVRDFSAGLQFIVRFPKRISDADFSLRAAHEGIVAPALAKYFQGRPTLNGIVIGYAGTSIEEARRAIAILAGLFSKMSFSSSCRQNVKDIGTM